ncbi:MAG: hypothetical protein KDB03_15845 [Planctomycetales bacterium]|nr:hypothetical protein [Planctomycetales bacterium]
MNKQALRILTLAFFTIAVLLRFMPHPSNVTPVAALALFAGCYLSGIVGIVLAFGAMAASDILGHIMGVPGMGFYDANTMLCVYFSMALAAVLGRAIRGRVSFGSVVAGSIGSTVIFFLVTNFACWQDPLMGYAQTADGLLTCYVRALPFAVRSLFGDLLFAGLLFGCYQRLTSAAFMHLQRA